MAVDMEHMEEEEVAGDLIMDVVVEVEVSMSVYMYCKHTLFLFCKMCR